MKLIRFLLLGFLFVPVMAGAMSGGFTMAAQLLAAAKNADIQQVQALVNNGADINYVDSTGLSIVCTALMNNDIRAAQILQMYGADASKCDMQIKRYNNRNKPDDTGGLFSGLSSPQSLSLAAAGAAVVAGGVVLLTDVFEPGNKNATSGGISGDRPNQGGSGSGGGGISGANVLLTVPYGPAFLESDGKINPNSTVFTENLTLWNPSAGGVRELDFNYLRPGIETENVNQNNYIQDGIMLPVQNYLLMMHGYSAFANEYLGQKIFRVDATKNPIKMQNDAGGGRPVSVKIITDNGLNPTGSAARGDGISYALSAAADADTITVDKYLNYAKPVNGVMGAENVVFDLSGAGTAMNPYAGVYDSALGKIVAGWAVNERSYGDFFGFVPYGRLGVYRTGGGKEWITINNPYEGDVVGALVDGDAGEDNIIDAGDKIVVDGITYNVLSALDGTEITRPTITVNGNVFQVAENSNLLKGVCDTDANPDCSGNSDIAIYFDADGNYYLNKSGGSNADSVFVVKNGDLYASKDLVDSDYKNFQALSMARSASEDNFGVIANVSVLEQARNLNYKTVADMSALIALGDGSPTDVFSQQIDLVYDKNNNDSITQGGYANTLFAGYNSLSPMLVMPAGEFDFSSAISVKDATFENYAPLLYESNLKNNFMTVVAVGHVNGTEAANSIENYADGTGSAYGKLYLSMYRDTNGTADTTDDVLYSSRQCGITGVGQKGVNPWCFSAAGSTAEMATASAAGAVASVKSAFDYMTNKDVFYLLALTADGYLLGTDSAGTEFTQDSLAAYLRNMYSLPPEYYEDNLNAQEYLNVFAKVYGYGLINLNRAMKPNHKIYYYDGNSIVSASGNAYWRNASATVFRPSSVLNLRGATIRAPFYDIVQGLDDKMSMPRIWKNEFTLGLDDRRGLYMGDVLGDLKTRETKKDVVSFGDFDLSMSFSERPYFDYLNGLDNLTLSYTKDDFQFKASYQHNLTDGLSKFDAMNNPILALTTNAITTDFVYEIEKLKFGGRFFSGAVTDEGLLENDPTISSQVLPAKLGLAQGGQVDISWDNKGFYLKASVGIMNETNTLLGAYTDGLLSLGNGKTTFFDFVTSYNFTKDAKLSARATFANTFMDVAGDFILGMSSLKSNSFAIAASIGNFDFSVSQPLAISDGDMSYAYADYSVVENDDKYSLNINDMRVENLPLKPEKRELRFSGSYRHNFDEFTDGAVGFIYRVNPEHTDDFGNESIFMLKLTHKLGI